MEIKYLADGRKVSVVGQINNSEYIVQEIFVTNDGDEIPSGEKFTTKNLLSEPMTSYADKQKKELEATIQRRRIEIENLSRDIHALEQKRKAAAEIIKRNNFMSEQSTELDWEYFVDVITGNMKFAVYSGYSTIEIKPFDEVISQWEHSYSGRTFEGVKSFQVWTRYDKKLNKRVTKIALGRYTDLSGGFEINVDFFRSQSEMTDYVNGLVIELLAQGKLTTSSVRQNPFYTLPENILNQIVEREKESAIKHHEDTVKKLQEALEDKLNRLNHAN